MEEDEIKFISDRRQRTYERLTKLFKKDEVLRDRIETAWEIAEDHLERRFPPSIHLLYARYHRARMREFSESLFLIERYRYWIDRREPDEGSPVSLETLNEDEVISRVTDLYGKEKQVESPTVDQVEEWIVRRVALQEGLARSRFVAFESSVTDEPMPPFEADETNYDENYKKRKEIDELYKESDNPLKERIDLVADDRNRKEDFPISINDVIYYDISRWIDNMNKKEIDKYEDNVKSFVNLAKHSPSRFDNKSEHLLYQSLYLGRIQTLTLNIKFSLSEAETEIRKNKLLATDFGKQWYVENKGIDLDELRDTLDDRQEELVLKIHAWKTVNQAIDASGDPDAALVEIGDQLAPPTKEIATESQQRSLKLLYEFAKENPEIRDAGVGTWKTHFSNEGNFSNHRMNVDRLAKKCFDVDEKKALPEKYRRYEGGGFFRLLECLVKAEY